MIIIDRVDNTRFHIVETGFPTVQLLLTNIGESTNLAQPWLQLPMFDLHKNSYSRSQQKEFFQHSLRYFWFPTFMIPDGELRVKVSNVPVKFSMILH